MCIQRYITISILLHFIKLSNHYQYFGLGLYQFSELFKFSSLHCNLISIFFQSKNNSEIPTEYITCLVKNFEFSTHCWSIPVSEWAHEK